MRVLFVSCDPLDGAVTRYRCTHLAEALRSAGHTADVATIYDPVIRLEHDIVVLHRICANQEGQALADAVRKSGATLVYGADDLMWEVPAISPASSLGHPSSPDAHPSREEGLASLHLAMLRQADGVLVSTESLAEFAREAGARDVVVVRNTRYWGPISLSLHDFPEKLWEESRPKKEGGRFWMLYPSGTATHDDDLAKVAPALKTVMEDDPTVRLILVGPVVIPETLQSVREAIGCVPLLTMDQYLALIWQASVVIAPLAPTRFNQGKSELKWLEAGSWSKPTLASRWGGFGEIVRDGENGLLAVNESEWVAQLTRLREDRDYGSCLGGTAKKVQRFDWSMAQTLTEVPFLEWRGSSTVHITLFRNPLGFAKGKIKSVLRRVRR